MSVAFPTHVWKMPNICKHIIVGLFSHMCAFSHTYVSKSKHVWEKHPGVNILGKLQFVVFALLPFCPFALMPPCPHALKPLPLPPPWLSLSFKFLRLSREDIFCFCFHISDHVQVSLTLLMLLLPAKMRTMTFFSRSQTTSLQGKEQVQVIMGS